MKRAMSYEARVFPCMAVCSQWPLNKFSERNSPEVEPHWLQLDLLRSPVGLKWIVILVVTCIF